MSDSFATTYADDILIHGAEVIIGTAMLGIEFGTVKSAKVKRTASKEMLLNGKGNFRAIVFTNPGFEMTLEVAFEKNVTAPAMGEIITLPLVGVSGRVQEGVEVSWEQGKERGLSIPVSSWDAMGDAPLWRVDPETQEFTLQDLAAPVLTASPGSGNIALDWADVPGATSYEVQVSTDSGVTFTALATPSTSTHTHTVTMGQTRHYRARAVNAIGKGPWSNTASATAAA